MHRRDSFLHHCEMVHSRAGPHHRKSRAMERAPTNDPLCPSCGIAMKLARTIPGTADLRPLNVFECAACGIYYSEACRESPTAAERDYWPK
jgi:predicted RNA-binding Zn-ribbon protein involved in translation (DUF1610 family)